MTHYYLSDRKFEGYSLDSDYCRDLEAWLEEHRRKNYHDADSIIVAAEPCACGFRVNVRFFKEASFWPKHIRHSSNFEVFHLSIFVGREYYNRWDRIEFDPLGEYPRGMKLRDAKKAARKREVMP